MATRMPLDGGEGKRADGAKRSKNAGFAAANPAEDQSSLRNIVPAGRRRNNDYEIS
jgi:hypothetical protein